MIAYEGYQFLCMKQVWTCRRLLDTGTGPGVRMEPKWQCVSDRGELRTFGLSQLAILPQVVSTPARPVHDGGAGHPGEPGSRGRYVKGCRCPQCKQANAAYIKNWRRTRGV